jgi:hypothetical protein
MESMRFFLDMKEAVAGFLSCSATMGGMIKKVINKKSLNQSSIGNDFFYWLGQSPEKRLEAVEVLRRQVDGITARLQRVARVIQRSSR